MRKSLPVNSELLTVTQKKNVFIHHWQIFDLVSSINSLNLVNVSENKTSFSFSNPDSEMFRNLNWKKNLNTGRYQFLAVYAH